MVLLYEDFNVLGLYLMKLRKKFAIWSYAFFIHAGYFKADPRLSWVPIDLTILFALVVFAFLLVELAKTRKVHILILPVVFFFVLFLPALLGLSWAPEITNKVMRFYTQSFLVAVTPFFILSSSEELGAFLKTTVFLGVLFTLEVISAMVVTKGAIWKITAFGSSVIAIGRLVGVATVYLGLKIMNERTRYWHLLLFMAMILVLFASGQRMAMFGPILAIFATELLVHGLRAKHIIRGVVFILIAIIVITSVYAFLPTRSRERVDRMFVMGIAGFADQGRGSLLFRSLDEAVSQPIGIGLGGAQKGLGIQYPHNIIVETFLEGGWLAGLALIAMLTSAMIKGYLLMKRRCAVYVYAFGFLVYTVMYAMVAGDINDNRLVFAMMGIFLRQTFTPSVECKRQTSRTF